MSQSEQKAIKNIQRRLPMLGRVQKNSQRTIVHIFKKGSQNLSHGEYVLVRPARVNPPMTKREWLK